MLATAEGYLAERYFFCSLESFANDGESFGLGIAFRGDEVGFFEEGRGDLLFVDELSHFQSVAGRNAQMLNLFGLDGDVFAFAIFVAFDDFVLFDGTFFGGDLLMRSEEHTSELQSLPN